MSSEIYSNTCIRIEASNVNKKVQNLQGISKIMTLYLPDPTVPISATLHEILEFSSNNAASGIGVFSFATAGGINLLFTSPEFSSFVTRSQFELIVGLDEITDLHSLEALGNLRRRFANLQVNAFLHHEAGSLFHPKYCFFQTRKGGILIAGSGNLTVRGLRGNWEGISYNELNEKQYEDVRNTWTSWRNHNRTRLLAIDHKDVIARARENVRRIRAAEGRADLPEGADEPFENPEDSHAWDFDDENLALIAEIPRGAERWNQANFDKNSFENFFGANPDQSTIVLLRNVAADGRAGNIESRPSVAVMSRNFRFELEAAAGQAYPYAGRPIGLFIRVATRMFLYMLFMPGDEFHNQVAGFLDTLAPSREDRMRRIPLPAGQIRESLPRLPIWQPNFQLS